MLVQRLSSTGETHLVIGVCAEQCHTPPYASALILGAMCWSMAGDVSRIQPSVSSVILQSRSCTTVHNGRRCVQPSLPRNHGAWIAWTVTCTPSQLKWITSFHIVGSPPYSLIQIILRHAASLTIQEKQLMKFFVDAPRQKKFRMEGLERRWLPTRERVPNPLFMVFGVEMRS